MAWLGSAQSLCLISICGDRGPGEESGLTRPEQCTLHPPAPEWGPLVSVQRSISFRSPKFVNEIQAKRLVHFFLHNESRFAVPI